MTTSDATPRGAVSPSVPSGSCPPGETATTAARGTRAADAVQDADLPLAP